ncbi:indole-3-glycerol phosphate synthase TrpC [Flavobacteriaceae bacterium TK19130]|nr:indole-3-glycerol phosphate synthase TrpC [Thermobacterium salinum]
MSILKKITDYKRMEVAAMMNTFPLSLLKKSAYYEESCIPFSDVFSQGFGIIAEHKRKSPSKGLINNQIGVQEVVEGYETAGAKALSVLTDTHFFGGALEDLVLARQHCSLPILRKEFIVDPYQIHEAKAYGADAILLIAACLSEEELISFSALAKSIGLDVLAEIHNEEELQHCLLPSIDMIGVNNRNLNTFQVSIETSMALASKIPSSYVKISESGINDAKTIKMLKNQGFNGYLIGECFMKETHPGAALQNLVNELL